MADSAQKAARAAALQTLAALSSNAGDGTSFLSPREVPTEHQDLAASRPAVVARLRKELDAYVANRWTGHLDTAAGWTEERYCAWIERVGWVQPFEDT